MNIAVCVKEVPSGTSHKRLDPATNRLDRSGDSELNPFDLHALEEAVRIREGGADVAEIVAVCMGPPSAQRALQKALALGADRAVLVTDPALAGSDIAGTAHVLASVVAKQGADLVLLGQQAADADCYVMAAAVADHLERPVVTQVADLTVDGSQRSGPSARPSTATTSSRRRCPRSSRSRTRSTRPGCRPSRPSWARRRSRSRRSRPPTRALTPAGSARDGARSVVRSIAPPAAKSAGVTIEDSGGDSADKVVEILAGKGLI